MGLSTAFNTSLSGLTAIETDINVIGNNVANAATTGFKQSTVEFATQLAQTPQGSMVGPPLPSAPMQLRARATIRAVVVLPTPRTPVSMKAWAMRPVAMALRKVRTIASWPTKVVKSDGRYLRARTR